MLLGWLLTDCLGVVSKKTLTYCYVRAEKKLGGDLLSHTLVCSTIGDEGLDF